MDPNQDTPRHISAQDARGGDVILRTRRRRLIFIAGLVGLAVLAILARLAFSA